MADPARCAFIIGSRADQDATLAGLIGLNNINLHSRSAEYWIYIRDSPIRGKRFASDATFLLLEFSFSSLGLHRAYLQVMEDNLPAINLYRKFGFFEEGVAREHIFIRDGFMDMVRFSIIENAFRALVLKQETKT